MLTKFDVIVSDVLLKIASDDTGPYELARVRAHQICEDSCRHHFDKSLQELPAETFSGTFSIYFVEW